MLPKPVAVPAARELANLVADRKKLKLPGFSAWPKFGTKVMVEVADLGGLIVEADLLSIEIDYGNGRRIANLRITDDFDGLSQGLKLMMPKTIRANLIDLRRIGK